LAKTPEEISKLRDEIDTVDSEIVANLDRRAELAIKIGEEKAKHGLPVYVPSRETEVLRKVVSKSDGSFSKDALATVYREIISGCRSLEEQIKVAFLGPLGTYTHQAAIKKFGHEIEFLPMRTEQEVFSAVDRGVVDYGVVAVENSLEGVVARTMDLFVDSSVKVCAEAYLPIRHCLLSRSDLDSIKKVYSHSHGLAQCRGWLAAHVPHAELFEVSSTARGVEIARSEKNAAAIGSDVAGELFELPRVAEHISDKAENTTRFFVIGKTMTEATGQDKTSIIMFLCDRPGALIATLQPFNARDINLTRIESRPTKKAAWEYMFYLDFLGHHDDENVKETLEELRKDTLMVKVIGSYPVELPTEKRSRPLHERGVEAGKETNA